ncbi:hypothetical protein ACI2IY_02940 [Lysobacter enzymogenes]|uniref:hypothetical protein n=1 Tax=Lysobacter enzymogenes TaxID=69 RepID=UPI00384E3430
MSSDSLIRWIDYALRKVSPAVVARSGEEGEKADFFSVHLTRPDGVYVVRERHGLRLSCLKVVGDDVEEKEIGIYEAWQASVKIKHYFGLYNIEWSSWGDFSFDQLSRWTYLKIYLQKTRNRIISVYIRTTKKITVERIMVLKAVYVRQMESADSVGSMDILHAVYGDSFYLFPNVDAAYDWVNAMLKSLVETGELRDVDVLNYEVTGKGVAAIEKFEEQERKHKEAMAIQRGMLFLTVALMFFAMIQAKVVEFPPLLKIEQWPWQVEKISNEKNSSCLTVADGK